MNPTTPQSKNIRIAFVSASWHRELVELASSNCREELHRQGVDVERNLDQVVVPGSLEIPLVAKKLAASGKYNAIVCFGLIVDGGIYRHEFVAHAVIDGIVRAGLDTGVPVLSVVLTPQQFHEHETHHEFFKKHLAIKGVEAAAAAIEIIKTNLLITSHTKNVI